MFFLSDQYQAPRWRWSRFYSSDNLTNTFRDGKENIFLERDVFYFPRCRTRDRAARRSRARICTWAACRKIWRSRIWKISSVLTAELSRRVYCATTSPVSLRKVRLFIVFASFPSRQSFRPNKISDRLSIFLTTRDKLSVDESPTKSSLHRLNNMFSHAVSSSRFKSDLSNLSLLYSRWKRTSQFDEIDVRENYTFKTATKSEISGGFK